MVDTLQLSAPNHVKLSRHIAILVLSGAAFLPVGGITQEPAASDTAPSPDSGTNNGAFRFTYPVRDGGSNEVYTEANPTLAAAPAETGDAPAPPAESPAPTPAEETSVVVAPEAPAPAPARATKKRAMRSSAPTLRNEPVVLPNPLGPDEFVSSDTFGEGVPDIGEGRFERRPFRFSFAVYEGYNSNVDATSTDPTQSLYTEIAAGIGYDFGSSRLKLNATLSGGLTFYYNTENLENDGIFPTLMLSLSAEYAATPRLDLYFETFTAFLSQPDFSTSGAPNSYLGDYLISNSSVSARYRWMPKLSTVTTYNPRIYYFTDQGENDVQGRFEQTASQQFLFLWKPTTSLAAEYRFDTRNYFVAQDLDSIGNFALVGFDHSLNPRSQVSVRGGVEQRFNQNPAPSGGDDIYIGPFGQISMNYAAGKNTLLGLNARYGTSASGLSSYNQGQQFLLGLSAAHQFTRRISANAFFNYQNNYYTQPDSDYPDFNDNIFNTGLNVNFQVNRVWSLLAGYAYTTLLSTDSLLERDYNQSIVYIGTELSF